MGKTHIEEVHGGLSPMGGNFHAGAEKECEESFPEDKGAAEKMCDELTITLIYVPLFLWEGGDRGSGIKLTWEVWRGGGKVLLFLNSILFILF